MKNALRREHKGVDYYLLTSDRYDGPRQTTGRRRCKRLTSKRSRRLATQELKEAACLMEESCSTDWENVAATDSMTQLAWGHAVSSLPS